MAFIVPAILEDTPEAFRDKMAVLLKLPQVNKIQVDFSDGVFTPRKTVLPSELDALNPLIQWEAHLMVQNPRDYFFDLKLAGFSTVIVHYEAAPEKAELEKLVNELREIKLTPGLAIKPETSVEKIKDIADLFEQILILGVNPGYQGQQMDSAVPEKVKKLKNGQKNVIIEVDGGVKFSNLSELSEAGTDLFVVGSALFEPSQTPAQNFEHFNKLLSETKQNHGSAINDPTTST